MARHWQALISAIFACAALGLGGTGWAAPSTPTGDFVDNGNGTATHLKSGLTWMRCAMGQTWAASGCAGSAALYAYPAALEAIEQGYAGFSDWRLPSQDELAGLAEFEGGSPTINATVFPATPAGAFLSATPSYRQSGYYWTFNFRDGSDAVGRDAYYLRLVRGGSAADPAAPSTPSSDFTDNGDGTLSHVRSGLTWMRCAQGKRWSGTSCTGNTQYLNWSAAQALSLSFAGHEDWRLPTAAELKTLVEYQARSPAVNAAMFPALPNLWSADQVVSATTYLVMGTPVTALYPTASAYFLNATYGTLGVTAKSSAYNAALLVRGEMRRALAPPAPAPVSLALACPPRLPAGLAGQCVASAGYNDFSSKTVTPTWSVSPPGRLTVSGAGALLAGSVAEASEVTITARYGSGATAQTASAKITLLPPVLTGLTPFCPATLSAGGSDWCTVQARYSDATSVTAAAQWRSSDPAILAVTPDGKLLAANIADSATVTITASLSVDGVTQSATIPVTVKPIPETLAGLLIAGESRVPAGSSITLRATATYDNGKSNAVSPSWQVSDASAASIDASGVLTTTPGSAGVTLTVSASHSENGVTRTATWPVVIHAAPTVFALEPASLRVSPGTRFTLAALHGTLRACTSSDTALVGTPQVASTGATLQGLVAGNAASPARVTLSCTDGNGASAQATLDISELPDDAERVLNWAEAVYPQLFSPAGANTLHAQGYTYRYYSAQNCYLAIREGRVYYLGSLSDGRISDVGAFADYLGRAQGAGY